MTDNILEIRNIQKSFTGNRVLTDVNISFQKGECHAICGENGAGKSTLMKILAGVYTRDNGEIILEGEKFEVKNSIEAQSKGICIIYQELSLIPTLSAGENMLLGRLPTGKMGKVDWNKVFATAKENFAKVNLNINPKTPVRKLTVAQRQLIEICRALSVNAKVVIMDEPTSSLSERETERLFDIIRGFKEKGITVIYISHKLEEIFQICDRVTVLKDGEMVGTRNVSETDKNEIVSLMVGRTLDQYYPKHDYIPNEEVVFEVKHLRSKNGVKDVSFQLHKGEILGFSGLVGAGRTETMRAIFGADKLEDGEIYLNGKLIRNKTTRQAINNGLAFATEDRRNEGLIMTMTNLENTTLAKFDTFSNKWGVISAKKEKEISENYIKKLRIRTTGPGQKTKNLSGGNQQKVVVAKWLNTSAQVFIFDEPTRGVDVGAKAEIYQLIVDLANEGHGVIIVSSELPEVMGVSDRIAVMHEGKVTGFIDKDQATEENIMALAVGGI